jgi:hypothetical protein
MSRFPLPALLAISLAACATESESVGPDRSGADVIDVRPRDAGGTPDLGVNDAAPDAGTDDGARADSGVDAGVDVEPDEGPTDAATPDSATPDTGPVDEACDRDRDGYRAVACGGDDCNDDDPRVNPGAREGCSFVDEDCDGNLNNGLECLIYAHSSQRLYQIDPFAGTSTDLGSVPGLFDFDTAADGTLYGISSTTLYRYDPAGAAWSQVGGLDIGFVTANGFAIDSRNNAWATGGNAVYSIDLATGRATQVGSMGGSFNSSGDCVVDKSDSLYMSSSHTTSGGDSLIYIDGRTGAGTQIGTTGFRSIYGLTAAWGYMFGFTSNGEVITIDIETGRGTLVHRFPSIIFYGAASGTVR